MAVLWPDSWLDSFPEDVGAERETGIVIQAVRLLVCWSTICAA